jgi:hypothetical protein
MAAFRANRNVASAFERCSCGSSTSIAFAVGAGKSHGKFCFQSNNHSRNANNPFHDRQRGESRQVKSKNAIALGATMRENGE